MTLAVFKGHEPRLFLDYLDLGTGKTLWAEPGGTYDMSPVGGGRVIPDVPEQWFTPVKFATGGVVTAPVVEEAVEEPVTEPDGSEEPEVSREF